jgi:hypothetical protein
MQQTAPKLKVISKYGSAGGFFSGIYSAFVLADGTGNCLTGILYYHSVSPLTSWQLA